MSLGISSRLGLYGRLGLPYRLSLSWRLALSYRAGRLACSALSRRPLGNLVFIIGGMLVLVYPAGAALRLHGRRAILRALSVISIIWVTFFHCRGNAAKRTVYTLRRFSQTLSYFIGYRDT